MYVRLYVSMCVMHVMYICMCVCTYVRMEQVRQLRTEIVGLKEELYGKLNATREDTCLCGERLRWLLIVVAVGLASSLFVLCWSCCRSHVGAERDAPSQRGRQQRKGLGVVR